MIVKRNYEKELLGALEYTPVEILSLSASLVHEDGVDTSHNRHNLVAAFDDDFVLGVNMGWRTPLNSVAVSGEEEFAQMLEIAVDLANVQGYDIEDTVRHESGHTEAWKSVGATTCRYEVSMVKIAYSEEELQAGKYEVGFQPRSLATDILVPKLAVAAMNVRPYDPSEPDVAAATSLGYSGVQEIGDRILRYNKEHPDRPLLLPLSYE